MERESERKVGGRVLRAGDVVKVKGLRGEYRIKGFRGETVTLVGGPRRCFRNVSVDRVGVRKQGGG